MKVRDVNPSAIDRYYLSLYERSERDPVQGEATTRATVPMGRGFARWRRFHPGEELVWVDDMEGRPRALTPRQARVAELAIANVDGARMMTMRDMARELGVAPSTVSRAMTRLAAWGIIAYVVGRGRFAGLVIMRRVRGDGQDRFREAAKARLAAWKKAAERRVSRLVRNVALYHPMRTWEDHGYGYVYVDGMNATLTAPWTVEDLEGL